MIDPNVKYLDESFNMILETFHRSPEYQAMRDTVEDSPWHREKSVSIHTRMVVNQYLCRSANTKSNSSTIAIDWTPQIFAGAIACMFHDIGKPPCMKMKFKEDRGHYKAFYGHEKYSARMFLDFVARHPAIKDVFWELGDEILYITAWMIEYHLPWSITDKTKRENLFATVHRFLGDPEIFLNVLLSDTYGRISDDAEAKREKAEAWADQFRMDYAGKSGHNQYLDDKVFDVTIENRPTAYVLIGPSGVGKSRHAKFLTTYFKNNFPSTEVAGFSLDSFRHELYGDDYGVAFQKSCSDSRFKSLAHERFVDNIRNAKGAPFILDNTNRTKKSRNRDVIELQNRGYFVIGVNFISSVQKLVDRQQSRNDKTVPEEAVRFQYFDIDLPSIGEFDHIYNLWGE